MKEIVSKNYFKRKSVEPSYVLGELIDGLGERGDPEYPVSERNRGKPLRRHYDRFFADWARQLLSGLVPVEEVKRECMSWIVSMTR